MTWFRRHRHRSSTATAGGTGCPFAGRVPLESGSIDGIAWAVIVHPHLAVVNGYVRVPVDHPWRGCDAEDIAIDVHGGLTYGDGEWFGFDCAHAGDRWPGMPPELSAVGGVPLERMLIGEGGCLPVVWNLPEVIAETMRLAESCAAVGRI